MRCLLCLAFTAVILFSLDTQTNAEHPKDDLTLIFVATSESFGQEFLFLRASGDQIFWSFYEGNESITTKKHDPETLERTIGKVPGNSKNLRTSFAMVLNPEKQTQKPHIKQEQSKDDYISPYSFSIILVDKTEGVKTCRLTHEQQVQLSHCKELQPVFEVARTKVALHKGIMMTDLLYAGIPIARDIAIRIDGDSNGPSLPGDSSKPSNR